MREGYVGSVVFPRNAPAGSGAIRSSEKGVGGMAAAQVGFGVCVPRPKQTDSKAAGVLVGRGATGMCGGGGGLAVGASREKGSQKKVQKPVDPLIKKFLDAVKVGDVTCVRQMLAVDASLCHATMDSCMAYTPLHWASAKNHAEVCLVLLEAKANVNGSNRQGVTALHSAALNGSHAVVEILLALGADVNATDANGKTAGACARSKRNNCVNLFQIQAQVQELTESPGAWTTKKMAELLKLCNQNAPSACTRHELEDRVRAALPALAHVWKDVLKHHEKFVRASFSCWHSNIRKVKWLARTSAQVQSLGRYKLILRAFRRWRVLEREVYFCFPALSLSSCSGLVYTLFVLIFSLSVWRLATRLCCIACLPGCQSAQADATQETSARFGNMVSKLLLQAATRCTASAGPIRKPRRDASVPPMH